MNEYISKQRAKDLMGCCLASAKAEYKDAKGVFTKARFGDYISAIQSMIDVVGTVEAADVQPVVDTENMATVSDEFICKKCGIYLKDYIKVVMDEDNDGYIDEQHYEYEPKFCPECGAEVKDGDTE